MAARRSSSLPQRLRRAAGLAHRYVGLAMAGFLIVAGLTGSMMAFYPELDALVNPELLTASRPADGRPPLDPFTLHERLIAQLPEATANDVHGVVLDIDPDRAVNYWVNDRETFVDPYSGKLLGSREFGKLNEGRKNLLTFLYTLHFSLGLGEVGTFLFGCVALLWTLDCFVGAYLTFPVPTPSGDRVGRKSWLARWMPAWLLNASKLFSLIFTWHRASGLWFWLMFLIFAWSAVALNMGQVYEPVMAGVFGESGPDPRGKLPHLSPPRDTPKLSFRDAHRVGWDLMDSEAVQRGVTIYGEQSLHYDPEHGTYSYTVESSLDVSKRLAATSVAFDGHTGKLVYFDAPTGKGTGSIVSSWLIALHFGAVRAGGLVYRAFVCAMGFVVVLLSVSGVWIWWKKRDGRTRRGTPQRDSERPKSFENPAQ